jgi:hypothetical protein
MPGLQTHPSPTPKPLKTALVCITLRILSPPVVYRQHILEQGHVLFGQEAASWGGQVKLNKKVANLYHTGCMMSDVDVHCIIANLWTFMVEGVADFCNTTPTLCGPPFAKYLHVLKSPGARDWSARHSLMHQVVRLQHSLGSFVTLANFLEYRQVIAAGTALPIALEAYDKAAVTAQQVGQHHP